MNKLFLSTALFSVLNITSHSAFAALPANAQLQMDDGDTRITGCLLGTLNPVTGDCTFNGNEFPILNITTQSGSYFNLGGTISISQLGTDPALGGIRLSETQTSTGAHTGTINGAENPAIDDAWFFASNTGMHGTTTPVTILANDNAMGDGEATLDFSGWYVTWATLSLIPMGGCQAGDPADNGGFSPCDVNHDGIDDVIDTGSASLKCYTTETARDNDVDAGNTTPGSGNPDGDCSSGNSYSLDYFAHVPFGDPSNFGGAAYSLHLEGTISTITLTPDVTIVVTGGSQLECSTPDGTHVEMNAITGISDPGLIASVSWKIDDIYSHQGTTLNTLLSIGSHNITVEVMTTDGSTATSSTNISIVDSTPPQVTASFIDVKSGAILNSSSINEHEKVQTAYSASDTCDLNPSIEATIGMPATQNGISKISSNDDHVKIKSEATEINQVELLVKSTDNSGNKGEAKSILLIK